jgi:hypothetical protein
LADLAEKILKISWQHRTFWLRVSPKSTPHIYRTI